MSLLGATRAVARSFDHVQLPGSEPGAAKRTLSKEQFEALPLQERVTLLVQGTLRFYRDDREIPALEAMRASF